MHCRICTLYLFNIIIYWKKLQHFGLAYRLQQVRMSFYHALTLHLSGLFVSPLYRQSGDNKPPNGDEKFSTSNI
jgi:hypothetical protein